MLDTTYLLPIFGVSTKLEEFDSKFPKIVERFQVLYNETSLIEAKWTVLAFLKREKRVETKKEVLNAYAAGLETLASPEKRLKNISTLMSAQVERIADALLLSLGVRDYFDRLLYASAAVYGATLLTEDRGLLEIPEKMAAPQVSIENLIKPVEAISWNGLLRKFKI